MQLSSPRNCRRPPFASSSMQRPGRGACVQPYRICGAAAGLSRFLRRRGPPEAPAAAQLVPRAHTTEYIRRKPACSCPGSPELPQAFPCSPRGPPEAPAAAQLVPRAYRIERPGRGEPACSRAGSAGLPQAFLLSALDPGAAACPNRTPEAATGAKQHSRRKKS